MVNWHDDSLNVLCHCNDNGNCNYCQDLYDKLHEYVKKRYGLDNKKFYKSFFRKDIKL